MWRNPYRGRQKSVVSEDNGPTQDMQEVNAGGDKVGICASGESSSDERYETSLRIGGSAANTAG